MAWRPAAMVMIPAAAANWSMNSPTPPLAPSTRSRASGGQAEPGQNQACCSGGKRCGSRVGKRGRGANPRGQAGVDYRELGIPAGAVREMRHCHDPVARN